MLVGTFHKTKPGRPCVAACIFSLTSACWRERVVELSRLVRAPRHVVPLSRLISLTCRELRRRGIADLVVSYADVAAGHHGGVYQASGWNYHGLRAPSCEGFIIRGRYYPGRSMVKRWGFNSRKKLAAIGIRATPRMDKVYWRALTAEGEAKAERLGLQKRPYPKPRKLRRRRRRRV